VSPDINRSIINIGSGDVTGNVLGDRNGVGDAAWSAGPERGEPVDRPYYSSKAKQRFRHRLGDSWRDLADILEIPLLDRGNGGPDPIWEWLQYRDRLRGLPDALDRISRKDLADVLRADREGS